MKKFFFTLAVLVMALCINAQTKQYIWLNGQLMLGTSIAQMDSLTFGNEDTDSILLYLPRTSIVHDTILIRDTVIVHDTILVQVPICPEMVDLGLPSGLKWANINVGATSLYDYGYYFQWGCLDGTHQEGWAIYCYGEKNAVTKYCTDSHYGTVDDLTTLEAGDDAAAQIFGGDWRMPTREEAKELWDNCTRTWETNEGISGYRFTGPNGNSMFLPSNGWWDEAGKAHAINENGHYWTSSLYLDNNNSAWGLITRKTTGNAGVLYGEENRPYARGVRAVHP